MNKSNEQPLLLTVREVTQLLRVQRPKVYELIRDGAIHTPTPDCFFHGLTRQTGIALARSGGFEVIERHITPEELYTF